MKKLVAVVLVAIVCFLALEVAVRVIGEYDADGRFVFRHRFIRPYKLPVEYVRAKIDEFLASDETRAVYHPILGWTPRPDYTSADGLYHYNSQGIRSPIPRYSEFPPDGVTRIALFEIPSLIAIRFRTRSPLDICLKRN